MEKNVLIAQRKLVEDLGTGRSHINLFIREEKDEDGNTVYVAKQQLTLEHPVTRARIINRAVECAYPDGASEACLRKGIENSEDPKYLDFIQYVQQVKDQIDEYEIIH